MAPLAPTTPIAAMEVKVSPDKKLSTAFLPLFKITRKKQSDGMVGLMTRRSIYSIYHKRKRSVKYIIFFKILYG